MSHAAGAQTSQVKLILIHSNASVWILPLQLRLVACSLPEWPPGVSTQLSFHPISISTLRFPLLPCVDLSSLVPSSLSRAVCPLPIDFAQWVSLGHPTGTKASTVWSLL